MEKVVVQTGAKTYQITDQDGNDLGVYYMISVYLLVSMQEHTEVF